MKNRYMKFLAFLLCDCIIAEVSLILTFMIFEGGFENHTALIHSLISFPLIFCCSLYVFRNYNILWRYASSSEYAHLIAACVVGSAGLLVVQQSLEKDPLSLNSTVFCCLLICLLEISERLFIKYIFVKFLRNNNQNNEGFSGNVMVIGGGESGCAIINDINYSVDLKDCKVVCVIDDDPTKKGQRIGGAKIIGDCSEIVSAAEKYDVDTIVFAIPSCSGSRKSAILHMCQKTECKIRILPSIYQMLSDADINVAALKKIEIEDLLGRDPIKLDTAAVMDYVQNKVVLVTGGGGSIGSELCRQIASSSPKTLIIFDIYENNAYDIQNELKDKFPDLDLKTLIGSVRDKERLENVFETYHPQIIYHAAAHKHVPLMEDSPNESIKNNVFGTYNTAECADKYGAEKFVLISTDKAVNPTNIMGASKRICEMIVQTFNSRSDTDFIAVRFGNVLGSNGSVIPLFKRQIENGGPVTVTDPNIIRYFMTIPEAVSLVLQAGASAKGGEIFVLDMGEPVKILDLAENLIRLSGYEPYTEIKIEFTGLRPGEKLYEELLMSEEGLRETENRLIHIGRPIDIDTDELEKVLHEMHGIMYDDNGDIRALVKRIVPTYSYVPAKKSVKA